MFGNQRAEAKLERIERKLDAILRHLDITELPSVPTHLPTARPGPEDGYGMAEIDSLLVRGRKIAAIKRFRELFPGTSLREAKDAVEDRDRRSY